LADPIPADLLRNLYRRHAFGIKLGLDAMDAVLANLGHPERGLRFIHVAGTNGKGSVCAMMESVLRAAGLRTALYTSPHLVCFHERIRVGGRAIGDADLADAFRAVAGPIAAYERSAGGRELTFFEYATVLALAHFARIRPDVVVWEVGMGGRLDATNVVTPALSVITGIALDHTAYLGPDLASIASEKAGIIKPNTPVVLGPAADEAKAVLLAAARDRGSRVVEAEAAVSVQTGVRSWKGQMLRIETADESLGTVRLPLLGRHQAENAAVALAALAEFGRLSGLVWPEGAWKRGLEQVVWPGRLQVLSEDPVVLVDGAHNPEAARVLAVSLKDLAGKKPLGFILGMCRDKDADDFLVGLGRLPARCWSVPIRNERSLAPAELAAKAEARGWPVAAATLPEAWSSGLRWAREVGGVLCVAGSLFLAGEVLEREGWGDRLGCPGDAP
jgi:dihydrofolate synthase/folylpolyglutamate synthase